MKDSITVNQQKGSQAVINIYLIGEKGVCNKTGQTYLKLKKPEDENEKLYIIESLEELEQLIIDAKNRNKPL